MIIYDNDNRVILDVTVDDNSYRHREIMGDHDITLHYSLAEHVELPVGAYCVYQGETFTLERPENFKMKHSRCFEYTVIMEGNEAKAKKWKFRNTVDGRLKFPLTAKPIEHLQMFIDNMNRRDRGWTLGDCIDGTEKLISYNHNFCYEALTQMASEFNTEFEIVGKKVSLRKVEYNKNNPLPLSYGRGKGFKSGVGRSNTGDNQPVEILFVQGGSENIDRSKYGSSELLLPKSQTISYDGEHFEDEEAYNPANARSYIVDDKGLSIRRADKPLSTQAEDSLDASDIYPKRVGIVSEVSIVDAEKNLYDIADNTIPNSLDFNEYLIGGEKVTIVFQSGMLVTREFEATYFHDSVDGKPARRFELVPIEVDGMNMPSGVYIPRRGDTYAVFKCSLPDSYICDNATKTGASWDMFKTAVKYMFDHEEYEFTFAGELDDIWAKKDWLNIGGRIKLGGYILFSDDRFQKDGVLVRITGIKDYINNPHSPEIELSNSTQTGGFSSTLQKLESEEVVVEEYHRDALQFTKRRFRDAKETMSMLEKALLENFTNSINPITVQTMSLLVGDESLQFRFVQNKTNPIAITHNINYDNITKQLKAPTGIIQHMTLGIDTISSTHTASEYKYWDIPEYMSACLEDGTKKYYLYAKVSKTTQTGVFLLSETAVKLEGVTGYYHLLVGILNSEYDGERSFVELYGFTEILPGRITTDLIVSSDGNTYFSLNRGEIGGNIKIKSGSSGLENLEEWAEISKDIADANDSANKANGAVSDLNKYIDGAFKDGIITRSEAKAIEKYINTVNATKSAVEATYNKLYTNAYLSGTPKMNLLNAKVTLSGAISSLISSIENAITDGKTTAAEKRDVDSKFTDFNSAYASFNTAVEVAYKAIQDRLKGYSDENSAELKVLGNQISAEVTRLNNLSDGYEQFKSEINQRADNLSLSVSSGTGKILYKDIEFKIGTNGTNVYSNSDTEIDYERVPKSENCPTDSDYMMKLTYTHGTDITPGLGGFYFATQTRANAAFETHILAKIPVGYTIEFATNAYGNNSYYKWLTSNKGTGKWEKYICRVQCGTSGEFSTTNFFYLSGTTPEFAYSVDGSVWLNYYFSSAVWVRKRSVLGSWFPSVKIADQPNYNKLIWYVGAATVYDLLANEDLISQINLTPEKIKIKSSKLELEGLTTINEKFKVLEDGSVEAVDGKFTGILNAGAGSKIGGMTLRETYTIGISAEFQQVPMSGLWYPRIIMDNYKKYQVFGLRTDGVGSGIDLPNKATVKADFGSDDLTFDITIIILSSTVSSSSFYISPYGYSTYRDTYIRDSNGNIFNNNPGNNPFDMGCILMKRGNIATIRYVMGDYYLVSKNF